MHEAMMIHEAIQRSLSEQPVSADDDARDAGRDASGGQAALLGSMDASPSRQRWIDGDEDEDSEFSLHGARPLEPQARQPVAVPARNREQAVPRVKLPLERVAFSNRWEVFEEEEFDWTDAQCFLAACTRMWGDFVPSLSERELFAVLVYTRRLASRCVA